MTWVGATNVPQLVALRDQVHGAYKPVPELEAWATRQVDAFWRGNYGLAASDDDRAWAALVAGEDHL